MAKHCALLWLLLIGVLPALAAYAQPQSVPDSTAEALRIVRRSIENDRRAADSLKRIWDRQWRISDSIRVESMLVRMRSDSLRKVVADNERRELLMLQSLTRIDITDTLQPLNTGPQSIVDTRQDSNNVAAAVRVHRGGRVASGKTLADSITAMVLQAEADTGVASYYAEAFHGRRTSSGEIFNMRDRTCAHRWLPFNTKLLVTNLANGRSVVVRVTDRGPWKKTRLIDVSKQAAIDLDMIRSGTARVSVRVVEPVDDDVPAPTR